MTSQTYSNKLVSFKQAFGLRVIITSVAALLLLTLFSYLSVANLAQVKTYNPDYIYCMIGNDSQVNFMFIILLLLAMAMAVFMFGFVHNKRASGMYLSLPSSRRELFISRYFAGIIAVALPCVIHITRLLYMNIRVFGMSDQLLQAYLIIMCAAFVLVFVVYSITSAVCLCVGTTAEAVSFSFIIIFGAVFLALGLNLICKWFLNGNAYGEWGAYSYYTLSQGFANWTVEYTPLVSMVYFDSFGQLSASGGSAIISNKYVYILAYLFIASVLAGFLAYIGMKRYKAENSGSLGVNATLNFICSFVVVFLIFGLFTGAPGYGSAVIIKLLTGFVASFIVFILCRFLLTLNIKKAVNPGGFKQYACMLGLTVIACAAALSGWFGYAAYQPDISEIAGVSVTYTGAPDFIIGSGVEISDFYLGNRDSDAIYARGFNDLIYTSQDDIRAVLDIHNKLIKAGPDLSVNRKQTVDNPDRDRLAIWTHIRYDLNDGRVIERLYKTIPASAARDMLALDETDLIKERVAGSFDLLAEAEDLQPIWVTDSLFKNLREIDPELNKALFEAVKKDYSNLSLQDKYYDGRALAVISLPGLELDYEGNITVRPYNYFTVSEWGSGTVVTMNMSSAGDLRSLPEDYLYDALLGPSTAAARIFVTERYEHTLALLKEYGYLPGLPVAEDVMAMYTERYIINPASFETRPPYFRSYTSDAYTPRSGSVEIDPGDYQDILDNARSCYYTAGGGRLVKVQYLNEDGKWGGATLFLPDA